MSDKASRTVTATVVRMTTAPKGEVHGAELDDGTELHWPPHAGEYFGEVVKPGVRLRAVGEAKSMKHGDVLEVDSVADLAGGATRTKSDAPPPGPRHGPPGPDGRIRALEEQLARLTAEVERLGGKVR